MLGGGNPVSGSNPSGTGSILNYIGDHVYGYSGTFPSSQTTQTMMEFSTFNNTYIVGEFVLMGGLKYASDLNGRISVFRISVNDEIVAIVKSDPQSSDYTGDVKVPILLEPSSKIKLEVISNDNDADQTVTAMFVGRQYN
tara:strand:+ start:461 stop:880 length:420 start_codon:yes stop_codon:yes gene_type:complete